MHNAVDYSFHFITLRLMSDVKGDDLSKFNIIQQSNEEKEIQPPHHQHQQPE